MANIKEIIGFNEQTDQDSQPITNEIFTVYGNDIVKLSSGLGYKMNLDSSSVSSFEHFANTIFFQNYIEDSTLIKRPKTFDIFNDRWSTANTRRCVNAKFQKALKSRLYLGYCFIAPPQNYQATLNLGQRNIFPSRVFYSDIFTGRELTWGIEWGQNGKIVPNSNIFELRNPLIQNFVINNIKVGDPIFFGDVSTGADPEDFTTIQYSVSSIENPYRLVLTSKFPSSTNNAQDISYWVGSNWFDVGAGDGDSIYGFGDNNDRLMIFKLFSLWYYTGSQLKKVSGSPGTSSGKSVINDRQGNTYFFHGSDKGITGIYRYNGVQSVKASVAIDAFIDGMSASNYFSVVAWAEGDEIRFFLGDLTNNNDSISMINAVATLNTITNSWDVSPIADIITCSSQFISSNVLNYYSGTSDSQVIKMGIGNHHNGNPIAAVVETGIRYPSGSEIQNDYPYIHAIGKNCKGLRLSYKLWGNPTGPDDRWEALGEMNDDLTEFQPNIKYRTSSGIQFRIEEDGILENDWLFEKISLFYKPDRTRLL